MKINDNLIRIRRGITLTELLVVVSIIVIVTSALVPVMQPILRGQNTREASRQLNVVISGVQTRATSAGRPQGIWLERAAHEPTSPPEKWYTCYRIFQAEQPQTYTGDFFNSRALITATSPTGPWQARLIDGSSLALQQVKVNDTIRFDHRGPRYPIVVPPTLEGPAVVITFGLPRHLHADMFPLQSDMDLHLLTLNKYVLAGLPPTITTVPYEVFRRPTKNSRAPIELPNNVGIDLSVSGFVKNLPDTLSTLSSFRDVPPALDIVIMFSPKGGVDHVHYIPHHEDDVDLATQLLWQPERPLGNVSLLLARDDKIGRDINGVPNISTDLNTNASGPMGLGTLEDKTNIWLVIGGHSGQVQSGPNAGIPTLELAKAVNNTGYNARALIPLARTYAKTGQGMGGR